MDKIGGHIFFLFWFPCLAFSQPVDFYGVYKEVYPISRDSVLFYYDTLNRLDFEDILQANIQSKFQSRGITDRINNGCQGLFNEGCHTIWLKNIIENPLPKKGLFYLFNYYFYGDFETVYVQRGQDSLEVLFAGVLTPLSKLTPIQLYNSRLCSENKPLIPLYLDAGEIVTVYSKIEHYSNTKIAIRPMLIPDDAFRLDSQRQVPEHEKGIFLQGVLWVMFFFNVCIFLLNRMIAFLWLAGYNLCMAFIFIYLNKLNCYIFPEHQSFVLYSLVLAKAAIPGFYAGFIYSFLNIPKTLPRFVAVFKTGIWSSLAIFVISLLLFSIGASWEKVDVFTDYYVVLILIPLLAFIYYALKEKRTEYYFFLAGNGFLLLGAFSYFIYYWIRRDICGWVDCGSLPIFGEVVLQYCIVAELLTFAAGLGHKTLNAEKEKIRLETLNEVKGRLYTNITHEFRTPLTVIMGMLNNIKNHDNERKLISRNSKNLLRLVNQLLDLSKLDAGKMQLDLVNGDIVNFLKYLTESFASMAAEKDIDLQFYCAEEKIQMDFDEIKLQHIIYNLISNAIKFTDNGEAVKIEILNKNQFGNNLLLINVSDTGVGIAPEKMPYIFDRFFQADQGYNRKGEGTGIGLTLTKELVELMGGRLEVESTPNVGSVFSVYLPIHNNVASTFTPSNFEKYWESLADINSENKSTRLLNKNNLPQLLIIEDNRDVAIFLQSLLQNIYQIRIAEDGQKGIDKAIETIPDIIISDVMMPEKDGYEVCKTLKQDERTSHVPIIMLTAKAEQKDKVAGLKHGADAYLVKPFDKEELFVRLEKLLELRKALQAKYNVQPTPPGSLSSTAPPTIEDHFLKKLREATESIMADSDDTIVKLEKAMRLSQMQLYRKLKALTGKTPTLYIRSVRLQKARELLQNSDLNVSEIAYEVGFSDPAYFSRVFGEEFGQSPSDFRK